MRELRVNVTAAHISQGQQESPWGCPVALAFKEHFDHKTYVAAYTSYCVVLTPDDEKRFYYCSDAGDFIRKFDCDKDVEPITLHYRT